MTWDVIFDPDFETEFDEFSVALQDELLAYARLLEQFEPHLNQPCVATLNNSKHSNMKELRFDVADDVWRTVFAFDTQRKAILVINQQSKLQLNWVKLLVLNMSLSLKRMYRV